ncbi:nuclear transport factor 2 family protein [Bacillus gobiensis]|uniref:nuclear transport factor 2 family protein n=1 Tax=Bacillus gobiensis TaxID=1441095 RepID=UPI003D1EBD63
MTEETAVNNLLSRYVRATDARDGESLALLFTEDALIETYDNYNNQRVKVGEMTGAAELVQLFKTLMPDHPEGGWSHHATMDRIVEIKENEATINAQFVMFSVQANNELVDKDTPRGGSITPRESGYYQTKLKKFNDTWKIVHHKILLDYIDNPAI